MIGNRDKKIITQFGEKLKKARKSKKLSIRKLALEADMDFTTVNRIERGENNPSLTTIYALAEALGVLPADLLP